MKNYSPLTRREYLSIKVGDRIERMLGFCIPMILYVNTITEDRIIANVPGRSVIFYEFDRETGVEIDEDISVTVSYISAINPPEYTDKEIEEKKNKLSEGQSEKLRNLLKEKTDIVNNSFKNNS